MKLTKVQFIDQLAELVGKKMYIVHSGHRIGSVTVEETKALVGYPFQVTIIFTGRVGKRMEWSSGGGNVKIISCNAGWVNAGYRVNDLLEHRSIEVVDEAPATKKEVKTVDNKSVVIKFTKDSSKLVKFEDLDPGTPFWYEEELYMADDEGDAIQLKDGTRLNFDDSDLVLPTTIEINVTGDVQ